MRLLFSHYQRIFWSTLIHLPSMVPVHVLLTPHASLLLKRNPRARVSAAMSNQEEDSQQGDKNQKKLSATDDLAEALTATSIVDRTATNTSSDTCSGAEDDDDGLFDPPPPKEECALCFILLPNEASGTVYHPCCGKIFCSGCRLKDHAVLWWTNQKRAAKDPPEPPQEITCPFCRADVNVSDEVMLQRLQKRMDLNDHWAFNNMAAYYEQGSDGLPKDKEKAMELYLRAVELGSADACWNIACLHDEEGALGHDPMKHKKYLKKAAKRGHVNARGILGIAEHNAGNSEVAVKHWMISAMAGEDDSLKSIGLSYRNKAATKKQYEEALRAHQKAKEEISCDERSLAEKVNAGGNDFSVLSESELAGLCGVRKTESAFFSQIYWKVKFSTGG